MCAYLPHYRSPKDGQQDKQQLQKQQQQATAADLLDADNCRVFVDRDGDMIRVMCCDYGFRTGSGRLYQDAYGEVPDNVFAMVGACARRATVAGLCVRAGPLASQWRRFWLAATSTSPPPAAPPPQFNHARTHTLLLPRFPPFSSTTLTGCHQLQPGAVSTTALLPVQ